MQSERTAPPEGGDKRLRLLRGTILALGFAVIYGVPFATQLLETQSKYLWRWDLYHSHGKGVCAFEFSRVEGDARTPVDRAALLGVESTYEWNAKRRSIQHNELVGHVGQVCGKAKREWGPNVDLRLEGMCAGRVSWMEIGDGETNVCSNGGNQELRRAVNAVMRKPPVEGKE